MKKNFCFKKLTVVFLAIVLLFINVVVYANENPIEEHARISFNFRTDSENIEENESINGEKTEITYKKQIGWNQQEQKGIYTDVKVALVKAEEYQKDDKTYINEQEICVLDTTSYYDWDKHEEVVNDNIFRYEFNQINYNGYYLRIISNINNEISVRYNYGYNENSTQGYYNVVKGITNEQGDKYYLPLNKIMEKDNSDINIGGFDGKYNDYNVSFSGYTQLNDQKNKLTYKYDDNGVEKNVYVEFIKDDEWIWNQELNNGNGDFERIENIPMILQESNNKAVYSFSSQNKYDNYFIRLSFDDADSSLEGKIGLRINGKRKEFYKYWDDEKQQDVEVPNKITLWDYNNNELEISEVCSLIGDVAVNFENIISQGRNISPKKECFNEQTEQIEEDENVGVQYIFENNSRYEINISERPENQEQKSWPSTRFKLSQGLKLFSDKIQNGDYRVDVGNYSQDVFLIVNGKRITNDQMQEVSTYYWQEKKDESGNPIYDEYGNYVYEEIESDRKTNAYIIKLEDIINGKISLKIGFDYTVKLRNDINVLEDGKTAQFPIGREEAFVKVTFSSEGNITKKVEEYEDGFRDEFYAISLLDDEISDTLITLDDSFDSNTMEVVIHGWGNDIVLPTYEKDGKKYVKLTELKRTFIENEEEKEEPYYLDFNFHLDIRTIGSEEFHDVDFPEMKQGYFTINEREDENAGGTINYYFLKKVENEYVYLDNEGNILQEVQAAGVISEFPNGKAEIKYAPGTEYIEIKVVGKDNCTEATNIKLIVGGVIIEDYVNVLDNNSNPTGDKIDFQDLVKMGNGRIPITIQQLENDEIGMGMTVYFAYEPENHNNQDNDDTQDLEEHNHTLAKAVKENEVKATCTKEGSYDEVIYCTECREEVSRVKKIISKVAHNYKTETKKATLKNDGSIITKCTVCGNTTKNTPIYYPKTVSLSKTEFTYNNKSQKPKVTVKDSKGKVISASNYTVTYSNKNSKKVGEYKVTIKFKGNYEGTKILKYYIKPQGTTLSKVKATKKGFSAIWKKQKTETSGYEIEYSVNKKFKSGNKTISIKGNNATSKSISKLKAKKTYYVRIRTYKTVNGKKHYSSWSKYKKVTTKK